VLLETFSFTSSLQKILKKDKKEKKERETFKLHKNPSFTQTSFSSQRKKKEKKKEERSKEQSSSNNMKGS